MKIDFNFGHCRTVVDFDEVALGPESACHHIKLDGKDYLEVSRPIDFKTSAKSPLDILRKSCIVSEDQPLRPDGTRICYWALYCDQEPSTMVDMGTTFDGDKAEFGRYILWNPETGELSLSEELDWLEVAGDSV